MSKHLLIFDIETIPCVDSGRRLLNLDSETPDETVRQKLIDYHFNATGNSFPRQPFHQVLCISFLLCEVENTDDGENYIIKKK